MATHLDAYVERFRRLVELERREEIMAFPSERFYHGHLRTAGSVRDHTLRELGFLGDVRRLNVALTRARRKLVVVGDAGTLASEDVYRAFVQRAARAGALVRP